MVYCFHESVLDGWDRMAFDTPILITFNNSLSFNYHESAVSVFLAGCFHLVFIPPSNQG